MGRFIPTIQIEKLRAGGYCMIIFMNNAFSNKYVGGPLDILKILEQEKISHHFNETSLEIFLQNLESNRGVLIS